ncbi:hypothetical protein ACFP3I_17880 [Chryseobacterium arachidis]
MTKLCCKLSFQRRRNLLFNALKRFFTLLCFVLNDKFNVESSLNSI